MEQITVHIEGMACGMCESHINDVVRKNFNVKSVKSSHRKGTAVIVSNEAISEEDIHRAIDPTGYTVTSVEYGPLERTGLFAKKRG